MDSTRDKLGRYVKGHVKSEETRNRISIKLKGHGYKHGGYDNPEYGCWKNMLSRTRTKNTSSYYYKMEVHEGWLAENNGFVNFLKDMGKRPSPKHSIDRIDGNKGYFPWNCRWATQTEQSLNQVHKRKFSPVAIENIRKARIGNKNALGHKLSLESRKKISENLKKYYARKDVK